MDLFSKNKLVMKYFVCVILIIGFCAAESKAQEASVEKSVWGIQKEKRIDGNSGNYLSLYTGFQPGFGITSNNVDMVPVAYIIPTYGLRRNIGEHFNIRLAFGYLF